MKYIVIFKFEKKKKEKPATNQALNILKTFIVIRSKFGRFPVCFLV